MYCIGEGFQIFLSQPAQIQIAQQVDETFANMIKNPVKDQQKFKNWSTEKMLDFGVSIRIK